MEISKFINNCELSISPIGRLDTTTAPQFDEYIRTNLGDFKSLVFDFASLEYISSAGLRILLSCQKAMNERKGTFTLKNVNESILEVLQITGFAELINIV